MKLNSTLVVLALAITFFTTLSVNAQAPLFRFANPTLVSGTNRQTGAVYRFPNVITNYDALVTIAGMTSGITLQNIDRTADGYSEAFQPEYRISSGINAYIDFSITFVAAGTSTPKAVSHVDASALDIDGSTSGLNALMEFNRIDMGGGTATFNLINSQIVVSQVGTAFTGRNVTGFLFGALVDTAAYQVMYTVSAPNVTTFTYRVGANTLLTSASTRYASLYFKRFAYTDGSVLSSPDLSSFTGVSTGEQVKLEWSLADNNTARSIVLEKALTANSFQTAAEFRVNADGVAKKNFTYNDPAKSSAVYYRLKIVNAEGRTEYSNVLHFRNDKIANKELLVFPSQVGGSVTAQLASTIAQKANFELVDYSGRVVFRQPVSLQRGENSIRISNLDGVPAGIYISTLKTSEKTYSFKINKL